MQRFLRRQACLALNRVLDLVTLLDGLAVTGVLLVAALLEHVVAALHAVADPVAGGRVRSAHAHRIVHPSTLAQPQHDESERGRKRGGGDDLAKK